MIESDSVCTIICLLQCLSKGDLIAKEYIQENQQISMEISSLSRPGWVGWVRALQGHYYASEGRDY